MNFQHFPDDIEALRGIIAAQASELEAAKSGLVAKSLEVEKLKIELARLKRMSFGRSSEKLAHLALQMELALEELEATAPEAAEPIDEPAEPATPEARKPRTRRPLPEHLPRTDVVHAGPDSCPSCGAKMRQVGEDVTEILDYVPGRFQVIRHVRPACSCRKCESMVQAPMPGLPILRGLPSASLLAHVLVSKYCDHLPLYRQSEIYAREGVDLPRSLLAGWVGKMAGLVRPLIEAIETHVMAASQLHADDTPVPVLEPGLGKTKTGRLWVYLRDERPWGSTAPPAVVYRYAPDRKGERPREHLANFTGHLHADGYAGFGELYEAKGAKPPSIAEVACWAHVRRKFYDIHVATRAPLAADAIARIGQLFEIESRIMGQAPDQRQAARSAEAAPLLNDLACFLDASLVKISGKSEL
ncbi:MAG: IS66 family transposase, partial [Rhodospirillales bacterium]|nr:IS66 family transposase [Rhodospirillales bacterium]